MNKLKWRWQMATGWICWVMIVKLNFPITWGWLLSRAGFYAHDEGYENHQELLRLKAEEEGAG